MIAFSRIYLDNFPHIQASWFSEGKKTGQMALHFGADDFGGTLEEENVHASANFVHTTTIKEMVDLIRDAGFTPVERDTLYNMYAEFNTGEYPASVLISERLHTQVNAGVIMPTIPSMVPLAAIGNG